MTAAATTTAVASQAEMAASQAARPRLALSATTPEQAKDAGRKFEAMFMTQMMQQMFETSKTDGYFGGGSAEKMFRPMLVEEFGKMASKRTGGFGISDAVARTLLSAQEARR